MVKLYMLMVKCQMVNVEMSILMLWLQVINGNNQSLPLISNVKCLLLHVITLKGPS